MVAHSGGSHGNDTLAPGMPNGSSSSSSTSGGSGGCGGVPKQVLKKGPWTAAEDAILMEYVKKNGEGNWNAVQKNTSLSRCGKSCRLRWTNHLRPNLKKGSFSPEEERLILQLHAQIGNKWARMAAQLPGRTDNEIKNYWNTRIKRRIRQGLPLYPNDVAPQQAPPPVQQQQQPEPQPIRGATLRGRPPLQIPTRNIFQVLAQSPSPSPTPSPIPLSPQSYNHLKATFTHSLSLFDPTSPLSPSTSSLPSPHSPTILSPTTLVPTRYDDHNTSFPGFSTSPLTLPASGSFHFSPLNINLNSPQGLQTPPPLLCSVYTPLNPVELPSNQSFVSQVEKPVSEPQLKPEHETKSKPSMQRTDSIALLEDLLELTEAMASNESSPTPTNFLNLQDEFSLKSGYAWDVDIGSNNSYAGAGNGTKKEVQEENESMDEELQRLLQTIAAPASIPEEFNLGDSLSMPPLDFSPGAVAAAAEDSLGLDMQQIASLFHVEPAATTDTSSPAGSCPWNNLPRMC